jgi:hypothetical protein
VLDVHTPGWILHAKPASYNGSVVHWAASTTQAISFDDMWRCAVFGKTFSMICAGVATLAVTAAVPAQANAQWASVYAVHGIPGDALGAPRPLPVDVAVSGTCVLRGFVFGEIAGPLSLPPGTYTVDIKPANSLSPCSESTLLSTSPALAGGTSYTLVAHLTEGGAPTLSAYVNDLSRTAPGTARVAVHHTAAAPAVNITLARGAGQGNAPSATIAGLANPEKRTAEVRPGEYQLSIAPASAPGTVVYGPGPAAFRPFTTTLVFAIGNIGDGSFRLVTKEIDAR